MPTLHATAFLAKPPTALGPVAVLHGEEAHLKQASLATIVKQVLGDASDASLGFTTFEGKQADYKAVRGELQTVSMFGTGRVVAVADADDFVTENRSQLEQYVQKPSAARSLLVLIVKSWKSNTKLAKKVVEVGTEIDCGELSGAALTKWLVDQAQTRYGKQLTRDAAGLMQELAGTGLTLLEQELAKLAAFVGDGPKITAEEVRQLVGGWRAETTWTMINSIRDGHPAAALTCLNKLLEAGEAPQKILGGLNFVFRKIAAATEKSRSMPLKNALQSAGVFPRDATAVEQYLRRVGRPRAERLHSRLVELDRGMKGANRVSDRLQVEELVLWLAGVSGTPAKASR